MTQPSPKFEESQLSKEARDEIDAYLLKKVLRWGGLVTAAFGTINIVVIVSGLLSFRGCVAAEANDLAKQKFEDKKTVIDQQVDSITKALNNFSDQASAKVISSLSDAQKTAGKSQSEFGQLTENTRVATTQATQALEAANAAGRQAETASAKVRDILQRIIETDNRLNDPATLQRLREALDILAKDKTNTNLVTSLSSRLRVLEGSGWQPVTCRTQWGVPASGRLRARSGDIQLVLQLTVKQSDKLSSGPLDVFLPDEVQPNGDVFPNGTTVGSASITVNDSAQQSGSDRIPAAPSPCIVTLEGKRLRVWYLRGKIVKEGTWVGISGDKLEVGNLSGEILPHLQGHESLIVELSGSFAGNLGTAQ